MVINLSGDVLGQQRAADRARVGRHGPGDPDTGRRTHGWCCRRFFTLSGGFSNGSLSFFLYDCPNAAFVAGTDYDTNDDAALDPPARRRGGHRQRHDPRHELPGRHCLRGGVAVTESASLNRGTVDAVTRFQNTTATQQQRVVRPGTERHGKQRHHGGVRR